MTIVSTTTGCCSVPRVICRPLGGLPLPVSKQCPSSRRCSSSNSELTFPSIFSSYKKLKHNFRVIELLHIFIRVDRSVYLLGAHASRNVYTYLNIVQVVNRFYRFNQPIVGNMVMHCKNRFLWQVVKSCLRSGT